MALRNENSFVSDEAGDIRECRTFRRQALSDAVDKDLFEKVRGTPWKPVLAQGDPRPRLAIDARPLVEEGELPAEPQNDSGPVRRRRVYIKQEVELRQYGYTPGCSGCSAAQAGLPPAVHSETCRSRIQHAMAADPVGAARLKEAIERRLREDAGGASEGAAAASDSAGAAPEGESGDAEMPPAQASSASAASAPAPPPGLPDPALAAAAAAAGLPPGVP